LSKAAKNPYAQYSRYDNGTRTPLYPLPPCPVADLARAARVPNARPKSRRAIATATSARTKYNVRVIPLPPMTRKMQGANTDFTACAMCGKANKKTKADAPVISGQKFTLK